jgi:hypothetical protein
MEFESTDPSFSVSWLLGLQPYQPAGPAWAKQYESSDPNFSVSWLLGLVPRQKSRRSRKKRRTRTAPRKARPDEEEEGIDPWGLRRLYDDISEDEEKEAESEKKAAEAETEILVETAFLQLCQELEHLLDEIECVLQHQAIIPPQSING